MIANKGNTHTSSLLRVLQRLCVLLPVIAGGLPLGTRADEVVVQNVVMDQFSMGQCTMTSCQGRNNIPGFPEARGLIGSNNLQSSGQFEVTNAVTEYSLVFVNGPGYTGSGVVPAGLSVPISIGTSILAGFVPYDNAIGRNNSSIGVGFKHSGSFKNGASNYSWSALSPVKPDDLYNSYTSVVTQLSPNCNSGVCPTTVPSDVLPGTYYIRVNGKTSANMRIRGSATPPEMQDMTATFQWSGLVTLNVRTDFNITASSYNVNCGKTHVGLNPVNRLTCPVVSISSNGLPLDPKKVDVMVSSNNDSLDSLKVSADNGRSPPEPITPAGVRDAIRDDGTLQLIVPPVNIGGPGVRTNQITITVTAK